MYKHVVPNHHLAAHGLRELTAAEIDSVGGGCNPDETKGRVTCPVKVHWRVIDGHGPMDLFDEVNQRILDHGDGLAN
jgi:hypothetical protein